MNTPGSSARAAGLLILLISVSASINIGSGAFVFLLCFTGVLAGAGLVAVGVRMADNNNPAPVAPAVFDGARALAASSLRRHLKVVGVLMASCAVTAVSGEADHPVLCLATFALLLLSIALISIGVTGE
ncbi:unnamed protein product [Urochloa humidicola]